MVCEVSYRGPSVSDASRSGKSLDSCQMKIFFSNHFVPRKVVTGNMTYGATECKRKQRKQ